jgi:hypothetical protein
MPRPRGLIRISGILQGDLGRSGRSRARKEPALLVEVDLGDEEEGPGAVNDLSKDMP